MENRYTNAQAAERINVTKNTLYRWEVKKARGDPRYQDFPAPRRVAHSNHRFYTDADIERIVEWKNRTIATPTVRDQEGYMSSTFLIAPVRGHDPQKFGDVVADLENHGWDVYWPARDTDQSGRVGLKACEANRAAIERADCVHVIWDGLSQGCLFDLGMAFALRKSVLTLSVPAPTAEKSFQNLMLALDGRAERKATLEHAAEADRPTQVQA